MLGGDHTRDQPVWKTTQDTLMMCYQNTLLKGRIFWGKCSEENVEIKSVFGNYLQLAVLRLT